MKPETARKAWELLLYFLLVLACILLIIVYFQIKTEGAECIRNPKEYLVKHFEKITNGNISCSCMTDNPEALIPGPNQRGWKILFGSYGTNTEQEQGWFNVSR